MPPRKRGSEAGSTNASEASKQPCAFATMPQTPVTNRAPSLPAAMHLITPAIHAFAASTWIFDLDNTSILSAISSPVDRGGSFIAEILGRELRTRRRRPERILVRSAPRSRTDAQHKLPGAILEYVIHRSRTGPQIAAPAPPSKASGRKSSSPMDRARIGAGSGKARRAHHFDELFDMWRGITSQP